MNESVTLILYVVAFAAIVYFGYLRPRNKEKRLREGMMKSMAVGDAVQTTTGWYGYIVEILDDEKIVVEFGSNKNCRIPMLKAAIMKIEKPQIIEPAKVPDIPEEAEAEETAEETTVES